MAAYAQLHSLERCHRITERGWRAVGSVASACITTSCDDARTFICISVNSQNPRRKPSLKNSEKLFHFCPHYFDSRITRGSLRKCCIFPESKTSKLVQTMCWEEPHWVEFHQQNTIPCPTLGNASGSQFPGPILPFITAKIFLVVRLSPKNFGWGVFVWSKVSFAKQSSQTTTRHVGHAQGSLPAICRV